MAERPTCATEGCDRPGEARGHGQWKRHCWKHNGDPEKLREQWRRHGRERPDREARRRRDDEKRRPYRVYVGGACERCGFVPEHPCQVDVDHIDGDHSNDDPANWQTLCANCHRLKTWTERQPAQM